MDLENTFWYLYSEVRQQVVQEQERYKISQIKTLLFESVLLAALVGLIVNQATDIITYLKGNPATLDRGLILTTLVIVVILLIAIHILINIRYISGISKILKDLS